MRFGPVWVEAARSLGWNRAAAEGGRRARRLAQRDIGLEEVLPVLPASGRRELFDECGRVDGRLVACRPLCPVRAAVEVEVAVLEEVVLAAGGQVRLRAGAGTVEAGMGVAGVVAHRVAGLGGRAVGRPGGPVWALA